jgi:predicted nucleotidyltransferase
MKQIVGYSEYRLLLDRFVSLVQGTLGNQVISIVLYGSVARGKAGPESDIDVLLVVEDASPAYWRRLEPLLPVLRQLRKESYWREIESRGSFPSMSVLVLSREEADQNRNLYLDMIEEARILVDQDGFFQERLNVLRRRLQALGARKVRRDGQWYWDLKPDLMPGESVAL